MYSNAVCYIYIHLTDIQILNTQEAKIKTKEKKNILVLLKYYFSLTEQKKYVMSKVEMTNGKKSTFQK